MGKLGFKIKKSLLPFHMLFGRKHYRKAVKNLYAKTGAVIFAGDPKYIDRSAKLDVFGGGKIYIGDQTVITQETIILVHDYSIDCGMVAAGLADPDNESILVKDVHIGNNTFIGQRATILPGVTIGNNCVVGAGCVVSKDIPDDSIVVGCPCKVIKNTIEWAKSKVDEVQKGNPR